MSESYQRCVGAVVRSVTKGQAFDSIVLNFLDGRDLRLQLKGDCCSSSYYTDFGQFDELIDSTIRAIEERDGKSETPGEKPSQENSESISWHFLVFITNKGHVTIDWRNDSNGHYDGSVHPSLTGPDQ